MTRRHSKTPATLQEIHLKEGAHQPHPCLNCGLELTGAYCAACGQAGSTHRYTVKSFLFHDIVHNFWHVDKSIFKTLKEVMLRPGISARQNIAGQRARFFPILTLLLLLVGVYLFVQHNEFVAEKGNTIMIGEWDITETIAMYQKWILLGFIPLLAISATIVFRKSGYNYAEQLVVGCYAFAGIFAWLCILNYVPDVTPDWLEDACSYLLIGYTFLILWQAFKTHYTIPGRIWRVVAFYVLSIVLFVVVLIIIVLIAREKVKMDL